jgi:hypothetical protein
VYLVGSEGEGVGAAPLDIPQLGAAADTWVVSLTVVNKVKNYLLMVNNNFHMDIPRLGAPGTRIVSLSVVTRKVQFFFHVLFLR